MCGFAGVVAWDEKYRVTTATLQKMAAAVAHRGPDGQEIRLSPDGPITPDRPQVGLAFRRLAVLDPDPRSDQPFTDGRRWMVFNGEIYNFADLKKELSILLPTKRWATTGDTEVLLAAYAQWGENCLGKLNGMFAFAVWDEVDKTLFLARDRMGQKPLYVRQANPTMDDTAPVGVVYFASELSPLGGTILPSTFDRWWGADYLRYGCMSRLSPPVWTNQMSPGTTQRWGRDRIEEWRQYFSAGTVTGDRMSDAAAVAATRTLVRQAVERQLVSDVPLGVFLSGGIDSSVVAACARACGPVRTFSVRFDDPKYDESAHARAVASHLGTDHQEFTFTPDVITDLPRLATVFGEPFGDSSALPTHFLAGQARAVVKVALSGDGGDELFGGYDRYRALRISQWLAPLRLARPLGWLIDGGDQKSLLNRVGRLLRSVGRDASDRYDSFVRVFDERLLRQLLLDPGPFSPRVVNAFRRVGNHRRLVPRALACDRVSYLPDDLLAKVDRCSMLHGLEVRSPFMDHELVTFAAGLTTDQLLRGGPKRMLREVFADDLPAWVFERKKMGFAVPIGDWFRGPLRAMLTDTLLAANAFGRSHFDMAVVKKMLDDHHSRRTDHAQRLYALLMLELWWGGVSSP